MLTYSPGRKNSIGDISINRSDAPSQNKKQKKLAILLYHIKRIKNLTLGNTEMEYASMK